MDFQRKVVVITGGGNGIGATTAIKFAKKGAFVVILEKNVKDGLSIEKKINSITRKCLFIHTDISSENSVKNAIDIIYDNYKNIDILINNVGVFNDSGLNASVEEWSHILNVNIIGTFLCTKYSRKLMKEDSNIVNICSISGMVAQENYLLYNTTKAALINMTKCLAMDLGKYNIRVNSVSPGTVWTNNNEYHIRKSHGISKKEADIHPDFGGGNFLQRVAEPSEIANAILFLASAKSSFITGENLVVDGGYTAK
ncbi:SDR family oxidoreductase [Staphylococcus ursi]|uniref:SDR family NAD(P)-dependent oxidoreductase n=1 Tax=Staphylococcus sp. MI 10-1553 TaxID=1912064 RepID=UPI001398AF2F|nr:SDR family oxidoreductase [Staphylococcus sp. MI 10-1553]QHW35917.1 SDR family oxidoreductase [Staphylococcus sp. MI 10-1553]